MQCASFIDEYTDFRDGWLSESRVAEFRRHMADCEHCSRYDAVVRDGVDLLTGLPAPETSDDFMSRLQHRVYNVDQGVVDASSSRFLGSAALVGIAAVGVLALFWLPFAASVPVELELAPVAAAVPAEHLAIGTDDMPSLLSSGPFVVPASLLDEQVPESFLDGELEWLPRKQPGPRAFLKADIR